MDKYVAIKLEVARTAKALKGGTSTPAAARTVQEAKTRASDQHGWGRLDYDVVDARVAAAMTLIRHRMAVPADKKADVDLVTRWKAKIDAAAKGLSKLPSAATPTAASVMLSLNGSSELRVSGKHAPTVEAAASARSPATRRRPART